MAKRIIKSVSGIYDPGTGCLCCSGDNECPPTFFHNPTAREFIHPDDPIQPPRDCVINEGLIFDGVVIGGGGTLASYCWWSAFGTDLETFTNNGQLEPRGQRWEFGHEFTTGDIQELVFKDCWKRFSTSIDSVVAQFWDATGAVVGTVDLTGIWNTMPSGTLGSNDAPSVTGEFTINVAGIGPIKSIVILQGSTSTESPPWIRFGELTGVSIDCTEVCVNYAYVSPQYFDNCVPDVPIIVNNFTISGTGSGWNLANITITDLTLVQGSGILVDNLDGTYTYTPSDLDDDVRIDATYVDSAAPAGCPATIRTILTCSNCPDLPCSNCQFEVPCPASIVVADEDLQGTGDAWIVSGGECGPDGNECPLEMTTVGSVIFEVVKAADPASCITAPDPADSTTINYSGAADLQNQMNGWLDSTMGGNWSVVVTDFGSYLSVTSIQGDGSEYALCRFDIFQGPKDESRINFNNVPYQDPCVLLAATSILFSSGAPHYQTSACVLEYIEDLGPGCGFLKGIMTIGSDRMTYNLEITNEFDNTIVSAEYWSGSCAPFQCDRKYALTLQDQFQGVDPNGNPLVVFAGSVGYNNDVLLGPTSPCPPPPPGGTTDPPAVIINYNGFTSSQAEDFNNFLATQPSSFVGQQYYTWNGDSNRQMVFPSGTNNRHTALGNGNIRMTLDNTADSARTRIVPAQRLGDMGCLFYYSLPDIQYTHNITFTLVDSDDWHINDGSNSITWVNIYHIDEGAGVSNSWNLLLRVDTQQWEINQYDASQGIFLPQTEFTGAPINGSAYFPFTGLGTYNLIVKYLASTNPGVGKSEAWFNGQKIQDYTGVTSDGGVGCPPDVGIFNLGVYSTSGLQSRTITMDFSSFSVTTP